MTGKWNLRGIVAALVMLALACVPVAGKALAADLELDDQQGQLGNRVTFTVSVNNAPNQVASLGFEVTYDPDVLTYVEYAKGALVQDFDFFDVNLVEPGLLRIGGFEAGDDKIAEGASGPLVTLTFDVKGTADDTLTLTALKDEIKTWTTKVGTFTYLLPTIESVSPEKGPTTGGQSITITGANFFVYQDTVPTVTLGGQSATDVSVDSATQITCKTPAHDKGTVDVVVTNPDSKSATLQGGYEYVEFAIDPSSLTMCEGASAKFTVVPPDIGIAPFTWRVNDAIVQTGDSRTYEQWFMEAGTFVISVEDSSVPALTAQATATVLAEDDTGALDIPADCGGNGTTVTIPVRVQNAPNQVASLGFEVTYDPDVLTYVEYAKGALVQDFDFFDVNLVEPGLLRIGGFEAGDDKIAEGASGTVVGLTFNVTCTDCISSFLEVQEIKDDLETWTTSSGCFLACCGCTGDVNGDGEITPMDALCAFETYLEICPTSCGIDCEEVCCDVTRDGECSPADALCIFEKYLELPSCLD